MKIAVGSDHAGYELKEAVLSLLRDQGVDYKDFGAYSTDSVDYPDIGSKAAEAVANGECDRGILICGTGIGMSITANKYPGIRAALVSEPHMAEMSRKHNDANVLVLPGWKLAAQEVEQILRVWLETEFEGGRHRRRLEKISAIEREVCSRSAPEKRQDSG